METICDNTRREKGNAETSYPLIPVLVCCVIVQFSRNTLYVNKYGEDINIPITVNEYGNFVGNNAVTKLFAGVINWFITCAKTIVNRKGHLMSDIATSASLPGSFLSTIAELASIPCFRNEDFLLKLRDAFKNGIGTGNKQIALGAFNKLFEGAQNKLDVTTEKAVMHENGISAQLKNRPVFSWISDNVNTLFYILFRENENIKKTRSNNV